MQRTKLSVNARVAEVESKLACLRLNLHGIRFGRSEVNIGPGFLPEDAKRKNFCDNKDEGCGNHQRGATGNVPHFGAGLALREPPDKKAEEQLRGEERKAGFSHSVG